MIVTESHLPETRQQYRDKRIVFTSGTFDLIHPGHLEFLEWCKQQGDILVVALNSDQHTRNAKGPSRPVLSQDDRLKLIDALRLVDYAVLKESHEVQPHQSVATAAKLRPNVAVLGHDWADREIDVWRETLKDTEIVVAPARKPGRGTSHIIEAIIKAYGNETKA